jgi:hypothetical protein
MQTWSLALTACSLIASLALGCTADTAAPPGGNPLPALSVGERGERVRGRVAQRLSAGSYSYLDTRLEDGSQRWLVVMGKSPAPGQEVEAVSMGTRTSFRSGRLDRTFDQVTFAWIP